MSLENIRLKAHNPLSLAEKVLWALFLVSLPITSFPFFPREIGGGTLVRPLAVYPLLGLLILVTLPRLIQKPLPKTFLVFLPFILLSLGSALLASTQGIEPSQGISVWERTVRAFATLGLGSAIYFTVVLFPQTREDLHSALRWLYGGFVLALFWGSLQAIYVLHFSPKWFDLLSKAQAYISIRRLFINRVSGLTYEPNWFADQISFLLLPWLLASVMSGISVFKWRWHRITVEWVLLVWALALLPLTFSRAGLFLMLVLIFLSVVFFRRHRQKPSGEKKSFFKGLITRLLFGLGLISVLVGLIFVASSKNAFFGRLWDYWQRKPSEGYLAYIGGYFEYLGFGARFTYWEAAYNTYQSHPILGVGLGNYAFYFNEMLPDRPLASMPEVLRVVVPEEGRNRLVTSKNFYLRLLAETGLLGTATFAAFVVAVLGCALYLWFFLLPEAAYWGMAGLLGMAAFFIVAFSFDSFAIPNMWVVFGLITSAAHIFSHGETDKKVELPHRV